MKKIFCLVLCICLLVFIAGCGKGEKGVIKTGAISQEVQVTIIDDDNITWLSNPDFEKINVKADKDGVYYLEFITTKEGKKALRETTEAKNGETLTFLANETLLFTVTVEKTIKNGVLAYIGNAIDPVYAFNLLTNVPDRTEGLTKPKNVIDLKKAKSIAFEKAGVQENQVTDLECDLDFDEDWRGWEYEISFEVGEKEYEFEINALTGAIINSRF